MAEVRFPIRARDFSLLHNVPTGSEAHAVSYPMGTADYISGSEADHTHPSSAEDKNYGVIPPLPQEIFMALWLIA
jgi:hypothetical protein